MEFGTQRQSLSELYLFVLVDLSRTLTAGVGLGLRTVRGTSFCLIQLGPKTGGSLGEMGKASSYRRGGDSLLLHKLIPHKKPTLYAAPRPESPRPPFSARNPRSWLCQTLGPSPSFYYADPGPGRLFGKPVPRAHGPAGLPAVVGILPFPGQRLGWMRDLLHEERYGRR
ncbi:UNVERIFIED_CONTAM: hypothetical protein Scaly_3108200 [Sesamum calycinum]|uniref:Uncharacterized protein n=1 Tax=Sesamum calycinum TaxID=2727403 RepID=A0AAW2JNH2_9LAMI